MKHFLSGGVAALAISIMASCGGNSGTAQAADAADSCATPAAALLQRLHAVVADSLILFGHHDDTAYGHDWEYTPGRSDVLETSGSYPALMNWDLGLIELGDSVQLDGVPFDFIRGEIAAQHARGGINGISWHPRNPATGGDSWDTSAAPLAEATQAGTALNDTLRAWIGRAADFILSLRDDRGERIPVLFRPWHEHTGSWFWWGREHATPEQYKALWRLTREVFDARGVDNVVWVYSPDRVNSIEDYAERYPGDEYVDVLGADAYHFGGEGGTAEFVDRVQQQLDGARALAQRNGKIIALSETGCEGLDVPGWYTRVLLPVLKANNVAFVCVWRNALHTRKAGHFYAPYKGHPEEADFKAFASDSSIVMVNRMNK